MGNMEKTGAVIKIASPRFATGDGVAAGASVTDSIATIDGLQKAGITVNTFPRIYADATDLTVTFTYAEPITNSSLRAFGLDGTNMIQIRTNLAVAARLQIPRECGAFFLSGDKKQTGIFIFTKPPTAKK